MRHRDPRYVLVSPVRDEDAYLETTIQSVLKQSVLPYRWIIVDDGSRDRTRAIVGEYVRRCDWMYLVSTYRDSGRQPGSGIIRAFNRGYEEIKGLDFDFIVKFDCDIECQPNYFQYLLDRFAEDPKLGIASGIYLELSGRRWKPVAMPHYHAAGQTKMVRRECFADINGFVASRGWDSYDEIKAQVAGWTTRHFSHIHFRHLKLEGSGIGFVRTSMMLGEIYYLTGGGPCFFFLKLIHYACTRRPMLLGALMLGWGYVKQFLTRRPRLTSARETAFYRALLNRRIVAGTKNIFYRKSLSPTGPLKS
jgi:biofilm PGA synthesis N-glycosyltransferase PgaC